MKCQECGREITSCTTVNGRIVCDWCKPKVQPPPPFHKTWPNCPTCGKDLTKKESEGRDE